MQTAPHLQAELQAGPHSPGRLWMGCNKRRAIIARGRGSRGIGRDIAKEPPAGGSLNTLDAASLSGGSPDQPLIRAVPERPSFRTQ